MDGLLCDELIHEIIRRLPPSSFAAVSLVSKRWLSALRFCTTNLSLSIPYPSPPILSLPSPSLSTILSHYPNLSSLIILSNRFDEDGKFYISQSRLLLLPPLTSPSMITFSSDVILLSVAAAPCASHLIQLRFGSSVSQISSSALLSSSTSLANLTNLHLSSVFPLSFRWLSSFPSIKSLSFIFCSKTHTALGLVDAEDEESIDLAEEDNNPSIVMLRLRAFPFLESVPATERCRGFGGIVEICVISDFEPVRVLATGPLLPFSSFPSLAFSC